MKIRTDFVTNSSSSSFILAFKDKETMLDDLVQENTEGCLESLLRAILDSENTRTEEQAIANYEEGIYYNIEWQVENQIMKNKNLNYLQYRDWKDKHNSEFQKLVQDEINKKTQQLKIDLENMKIIAEVEYDDYEEVCHVAGNLSACKAIIDNH